MVRSYHRPLFDKLYLILHVNLGSSSLQITTKSFWWELNLLAGWYLAIMEMRKYMYMVVRKIIAPPPALFNGYLELHLTYMKDFYIFKLSMSWAYWKCPYFLILVHRKLRNWKEKVLHVLWDTLYFTQNIIFNLLITQPSIKKIVFTNCITKYKENSY